jgi:hypothetical protein
MGKDIRIAANNSISISELFQFINPKTLKDDEFGLGDVGCRYRYYPTMEK